MLNALRADEDDFDFHPSFSLRRWYIIRTRLLRFSMDWFWFSTINDGVGDQSFAVFHSRKASKIIVLGSCMLRYIIRDDVLLELPYVVFFGTGP